MIQAFLSSSCCDCYTVTEYEVLDSTNTKARQLAENGAAEGMVIVAHQQEQGRGRFGRSFFSPSSTGLYMSVVLRPRIAAEHALYITTAAAVAVAEAAENLTGEPTSIKWVNDVYCRGKKVCGILTEGRMDGDTLQYAVLGIGVNLAPPSEGFPDDLSDKAGALLQTVSAETRDRLAADILERFWRYYTALEKKTFLEKYRSRSLLDGKAVHLLTTDGTPTQTVQVLGVDDEFSLIVKGEDGNIRHLSSGGVSIGL